MVKYLILGANGQLAKEFQKRLTQESIDYVALDHKACDVSDLNQVLDVFDSLRPQVVLNCSAYNLVDKAESEYSVAYRVNSLGVRNLAFASKRYNSYIITYSTDYVFDGNKETGPYTEEDVPFPVNEYGKSKLTGERWLLEEGVEKHLIFRTSWVYGEGTQNFIYKLVVWSNTKEYLKISYDEISIPTSTNTIVDISLRAIDREFIGLYHLTNSGYASRYEWAKESLKLLGIKSFICPVSSEIFNLSAKRPKFSAMSNNKIAGALNIEILDWREELKNVLKR